MKLNNKVIIYGIICQVGLEKHVLTHQLIHICVECCQILFLLFLSYPFSRTSSKMSEDVSLIHAKRLNIHIRGDPFRV